MSATPFDRRAVLDNFGGDEALLRQVAALVVEQWTQSSARLTSAFAARDLKALRAEAHAVKGSFANLAADAAVAAARGLEAAAAGEAPPQLAGLLRNLQLAGDELIAALRRETDG